MADEILRAMASDLGINRYENESKSQYTNRVIYSAMASWIKASALDRPVTSVQTDHLGVSRRHIVSKCTSILYAMLKRFPESKLWFEPESAEDNPIVVLLTRLIRHGDLLKVGFETDLILAGSSKVSLSDHVECRKGEVLLPETYYSGLALIQKKQGNFLGILLCEPEAGMDTTVWFWDYVRSAWWKETGIDENVQFFNAYKKTRNNHSCWQWEKTDSVKGLWLVRRDRDKNGYEYYLLREDEGLYKHQLDPFLQEIGEHRRFMIAMRYMAGNEVPIQIYHYPEHILVKLRIHLPQKESSLLETYAWPHNTVMDRLEWDMGKDVWEFIKPQLCSLGLKLMEEGEQYG